MSVQPHDGSASTPSSAAAPFDLAPSGESSLPSRPYAPGQGLPYGGGRSEEAPSGGRRRAVGSRAEVMHGTAHHTSGGLTKKDLKYNKWGRIVSVKKSATAKREKRLRKAGYTAKKGKFGAVKIAKKTARRR